MIQVLLIEDNLADAERIRTGLQQSANDPYLEPFEFRQATSLAEGLSYIKSSTPEVILLDLGLPDSHDLDGIERLKAQCPLVPIIVLTRREANTLVGLEAVKRGAQDYFSKGHLTDAFSLDRTIRYAIQRKMQEGELFKAREEALKASKAKSAFLANMSHDIRTPLNCIIGIAELLGHSNVSDETMNYVRMLTRASENLLGLINDILDLSKIESGQVVFSQKPMDLLDTVETVLDIISPRAHDKNLELIFKISPEVPRN
jgi:signal transduction histidine kinase